jgi:hypothetical protein
MKFLRLRGLLKEVYVVHSTQDHVLAQIKFICLELNTVV